MSESFGQSNDRCLINLSVSNQVYQGLKIMSGKTDEVKGRIKEAAGALTGNDKLRAEGQVDQVVGEVKQVAEKVNKKIEKSIKKLKE
jgi:uncharacterized protein YjbJ (UPF0337 family)